MKYLFIFTHLASGNDLLCNALSEHTRFIINEDQLDYNHTEKLVKLKTIIERKEKNLHAGMTIVEKVFYNHQFSCYALLDYIYPIFLIREPVATIYELIHKHNYSYKGAERYYSFRLRRMCEIANKSKKGMLVTYPELQFQDVYEKISEVLELTPEFIAPEWESNMPNFSVQSVAQRSYEKYLGYLRTRFNVVQLS